MEHRAALLEAVEAVEGQSALVRALHDKGFTNIRQSHVWNWLYVAKRGCPAHLAGPIEEITGVSRARLRPDVFTVTERV